MSDTEFELCDSAKWIHRNSGKEISTLGNDVAAVIGAAGSGIHNAPINIERTDWAHNVRIVVWWGGSLCNWDEMSLSLLFSHAADRFLRFEIRPASPRVLRLVFSKRNTRTGSTAERLPRASDLVDISLGKIKKVDLQ